MSLKPQQINFDDYWPRLKKTTQDLLTLNDIPNLMWSTCFSDVYTLCVSYPEPKANRLYDAIMVLITDHVKGLLQSVASAGTDELLINYHTHWKKFQQGVRHLDHAFSYLNTQHIRKTKTTEAEHFYGSFGLEKGDQLEIGQLGFELWKTHMIKPLEMNLKSAILDSIHRDRDVELGERELEIVRGSINSLVEVQAHKKAESLLLYRITVEDPVKAACFEYYKAKAAEWVQSNNVSEYMSKVLKFFKEEENRLQRYMHETSHDILKNVCQKCFVVDYLARFNSEINSIVNEEKREDMLNMYLLLRRINNGTVIYAKEFVEHVKEVGIKEVNALTEDNLPITFTETILRLYKHYKGIVADLFEDDPDFLAALDKACTHITNNKIMDKAPRSPELLARYMDNFMKKTPKQLSDSEIEEKLNDSLIVFKFLEDKDVFQRFYSRQLARRLLYQQSQYMHLEESMINALKRTCGYEFTIKLHRMFTDIKLSEENNAAFHHKYLEVEKIDLDMSFGSYVLQAGSWPLSQAVLPFATPAKLNYAIQQFQKYYYKKYNGRKLSWLHNLSQGDLKVDISDKPYIVTMSTYQMAIMMLFERVNTIVYGECRNMIQVEEEPFSKAISNLIECKLINIPDSEDVTDDTVLSLNLNYSNKRTKLRIVNNAVQSKDYAPDVLQAHFSVEEDRKLYLQAAIVRMMKSQKLVKHDTLLEKITKECKSFKPAISLLKKCIESLIEKQYIQRSTDKPDEYSYIA